MALTIQTSLSAGITSNALPWPSAQSSLVALSSSFATSLASRTPSTTAALLASASSVSAATSTPSSTSVVASTATSTVPSPSATEDARRGLTIGTTVGVGVGVAVVACIILLLAFVLVRRRRKIWGKKRKEQGEPALDGDTPNEEITKKTKGDAAVTEGGVAELGSEHTQRAELNGGADEKHRSGHAIPELGAQDSAHEMASGREPAELEQTRGYVAELDGTAIERMKSTKKAQSGGVAATSSVPDVSPLTPGEAKGPAALPNGN